MLPPTRHPDETRIQFPVLESQPSRTGVADRDDSATSERQWLSLWGAEPQSAEAHASGAALWPVLGGILLLVGVIAFFRYLAADQVSGGCCGGGLVVLAGLIFLVIGLRDRGDFSR